MTFSEINETIKAYSRSQEREQKNKAFFDYRLANLIVNNLSNSLSQEPKTIYIWDVYPNMFNDLKKEHDEAEKEQQWKVIKARLESYSAQWKSSKGR